MIALGKTGHLLRYLADSLVGEILWKSRGIGD